MIFDKTLLFSDAQAITADAASTNIVDLGATGQVYGHAAALTRDVGKGNCIPIHIQVVEAFNNLTSLRVVIQSCAAENFGSAVQDEIEQVIPLAGLTLGRTIAINCIPPGTDRRYLRVFYDITGTAPTLGKVTSGIVVGQQSNGVPF